MESSDKQDNQDNQDTPITDKMSNSLDDYYCDDYDGDNEYEHINTQDLITCGNCGNVWDGYAQCNCYQINFYDSQTDPNSSDEQEQEQDLENPARKAAFEKSRAKKKDLYKN